MCHKTYIHDKAMKKMETINRYRELKSQHCFIARACDVAPSYVYKVLKGERLPKSKRAVKAAAILEKADQLLAILERPEPYNKII